MVRLSDFVETVLREIATARTKAALTSARIAADFRDHPLLAELPVPTFRMERVEFDMRFAVAAVQPPPSGRFPLPREATLKLVDRIVTRLPESNRVGKAFAIVPKVGELWKLEGSRTIVAALAREPLEEMTLPGILALTGNLAKNRYLELLADPRARVALRRIREVVAKEFPDRVAAALRDELAGALERAAAEKRETQPDEAALEVLVTVEELKGAREVSTLRLVLEEDEVELALPPSDEEEEEGDDR